MNTSAHAFMLHQAMTEGNWPEVESLLRKHLKTNGRDLQAQVQLADVLLKLQRPEEALKPLQKALKIDKHSLPAHFLRGRIMMLIGNAKEAAESFNLCLAAQPDDPEILFRMAKAELELGKAREASERIDTVLEASGIAENQRVNIKLVHLQALRDAGQITRMRALAKELFNEEPGIRSTVMKTISSGSKGSIPLRISDM